MEGRERRGAARVVGGEGSGQSGRFHRNPGAASQHFCSWLSAVCGAGGPLRKQVFPGSFVGPLRAGPELLFSARGPALVLGPVSEAGQACCPSIRKAGSSWASLNLPGESPPCQQRGWQEITDVSALPTCCGCRARAGWAEQWHVWRGQCRQRLWTLRGASGPASGRSRG